MKSTILHLIELAAIVALVWGATKLFPGVIKNEQIQVVLLVVLSALAKFARSSESIPIKDYVNT